METNEPLNLETSSLKTDEQILNYLESTAKWGKFLAILGFISIGFMVLAGIVSLIFMPTFNEFNTSVAVPPFINSFISVVYLGMAILYFFPTLYLYLFSEKMIQALEHNDQENFVAGFENLKSLFKFVGILTIVCIGLFILTIIGSIVAAVFMTL
jgi:small-conductance mechanosensitive channel